MKKALGLCFLFLLAGNTYSFGQVTSGDSLALVSFFNATGGSGWTTKTNWNSTNPVGTWHGVTVSNGRVITLNLTNNNLTGSIPASLTDLSNLTQLQLFGNQLTGSIPSQIGNLVNLTSLGLENNQLSGLIPESISNLTILSSLTLAGNRFTDSVPVTFNELTSLQQFDIRNNRISVFPDLSSIGTLNTLRTENNRLTFEDIEPNIGITTFTYSPQDSVGNYASVNAAEGSVLQLTATVGGAHNTYQWKKNGAVIPGATAATLQIDSVKTGDAGVYTCDITNTSATALTLRRRTTSVTVTGTAPGAPASLTATAVSTSQINLSWVRGTGILTRYRIYRSTSAGAGFAQIDSITNNAAASYSNAAGLNSKTIYFYRVTAVGNFGVSAASNTASDTTFNASPARVLAIADTSITEGFPKIFYRKLSHIFSDTDDGSLTYGTQANPAQILATVSNDTLYLKGVAGFLGMTPVIVSASDGFSSAADTFNVTLVDDILAPVITSIQKPASTSLNTAFTVSCNVTDNGSISAVRMFYKTGTASAYDSVNATATGAVYSTQIPDAASTLEGVSLFIKAVDNGGNIQYSDTFSVPVAFTSMSSSSSASEYPTGIPSDRWRLVSVPVNLNNKDLSQLFITLSSSQWIAYNAAGTKVTTILPGQAFWFFHKSGDNALSASAGGGTTNPPSGFQITLAPGWNLVGTPFTTPITLTLDPLQFSGPWAFGGTGTEVGGWSKATAMKPFGGYAIYNKNLTATTLTFTPGGVTIGKSTTVKQAEEFKLKITAEAVKNGLTYTDRSNAFAVLNDENAALYNDPEPDNIGDFISVYFIQGDRKFSYLYQNDENEGRTAELAVGSSMDDVTIKLDFGIEKIKEGWQIRIYDYARNAYVSTGGNWSVYHKYAGTAKYKILAGTSRYLDEAASSFQNLPKDFSLSQNYPNPFNPSTKISYAIPKQSRVTLTVYNILGQEVATLLNGKEKEVGFHTVEWNGADHRGRAVSSGVYLYRIQAEGINGEKYTQTKKMLFVK